MAIQPFTSDMYVDFAAAAPAFTNGTMLINASGERAAFNILVPKTGTLDWFELRLGTVSISVLSSLRLSFQNIATGNADGTQDQYVDVTGALVPTATWFAPPTVMTNDGTAIGTKRSVTQGDKLSCVVEFGTFTAADSVIFSTLSSSSTADQRGSFPYISRYTASAWVKQNNLIPLVALKYSDGTYAMVRGSYPLVTVTTTTTFNSGSTPDERGVKFTVPVPTTLTEFFWRCAVAAGVGYDIVLYDASGSVLATYSTTGDEQVTTAGSWHYGMFASTISISANTVYRLVIKPTSTSNVTVYSLTVNAAGLMAALPGGATFVGTSRTDGGAWTDETVIRYWMGTIFGGFSDVMASGGGALIDGGLVS